MGIASFVFGILAIITVCIPFISLPLSILGLIFGVADLNDKKKKGEKSGGLTVAGIVISGVTIVLLTMITAAQIVNAGKKETNTTPKAETTYQMINTSKESNKTEKTEVKTRSTNYKVGETYRDRNIAIKYISIDNNFTNYSKYATVKSGYKIIKAEFEFENLSSSDEYISTYEFDCYADGYNCDNFWPLDESIFSATLSKGKKVKGAVYFQVPQNAEEIVIEYQLNMWTSERIGFEVK